MTGSSGFVGSHLKQHLRDRHLLRLLSRSSAPDDLEVCSGPLSSTFDYRPLLHGCDAVIHCAAIAHQTTEAARSTRDNYFEINCDATLKLAKSAAEVGVPHFIFLSSAKVCGEVTERSRPFTEFSPANPTGAYAESKAKAEQELIALGKETDIVISIIRPPLIYGPGVKANFLSLIKAVALGLPFVDCADAGRRSIVSIWNLCSFIEAVVNRELLDSSVYMVSDGSDCSTLELVSFMAAARRKKILSIPIKLVVIKLLFRVINRAEVCSKLFDSFQLDISRSCNALSWKPLHDTKEGVQRMAMESDVK